MRLIGRKSNTILTQESHHAHKCDALITIDESVVLRQTESIYRGKLRQLGLLIVTFVERSFDCRSQQAIVTQSRRAAEATQLTAMDRDDLLVGQPFRFGAHATLQSFCQRR